MILSAAAPIVGLLSYLRWRISRRDTMGESIGFQEEHPVEDERRLPMQQS